MLIFQTGSSVTSRLRWYDRSGAALETVGPPADYDNPDLSPDGRRVVVEVVDPRTRTQDLWVLDLGRDVSTRFTFEPTSEFAPLWSPDGERILYASDRSGTGQVYAKPASGMGEATLVYGASLIAIPGSWSSSGSIACQERGPGTRWDVVLTGDSTSSAATSA